MLSPELIGRRVRLLAWYDHPSLVASRRGTSALREGAVGTVTRVDDRTGRVAVLVEGLGRVFVLPREDVEVLASVWVTCPSCAGSGRVGGRSCFLCAGSGSMRADVADDSDGPEELEAGPRDDG
jgi:hypothetical protein